MSLVAGWIFLLANISIGGVSILLPALLMDGMERRFSPQSRKTVLSVSLASLAVMVFLSLPVRLLHIPASGLLSGLLGGRLSLQGAGDTSSGGAAAAAAGISAQSCSTPANAVIGGVNPEWLIYAVILWGCGAFLCLFLLVNGIRNLSKMKVKSYPVVSQSALMLLSELKDKVTVDRPVELLLNDSVFSPVSFGFFKPVIALPAEAVEWNGDRLRIVLLHELAHIKRRDYALNILVRAVCAFFWFNPLVWLAAGRCRSVQESACDDRVLEMGISPPIYARELLELTFYYQHLKPRVSLPSSLYKKSRMEKRILDILDKSKGPRKSGSPHIPAFILSVSVFSIAFSFVNFVGASNGSGALVAVDTIYSAAGGNTAVICEADGAGPGDIPDLWPVSGGEGSISSDYGDEIVDTGKGKIRNPGIDIADDSVMLVVASADGEVVKAGTDSILVHHKSGMDSYYGNLCVVSVKDRQAVTKGGVIGYCYSGRIHFELMRQNVSVDPMKILKTGISWKK